MRARPLRPAPRATEDERRAQRRSTWRLLLIGVISNAVGCGIHYSISPPWLGGAQRRPSPPAQLVEPAPSGAATMVPGSGPEEEGKP